MKLNLKKIASIQMGYSFRMRLDFMDQGQISVVQSISTAKPTSAKQRNATAA
jgi:hypothetical protein